MIGAVRLMLYGGVLFAAAVLPAQTPEDLLVVDTGAARPGGRIVVALRSQPKTLNPVAVRDAPTREITQHMMADLISINRQTQSTEPGLARSWTVSRNGLHYTLHLRRGLLFSDGHPCDAADVVFSFRVYLDEKTASPQRDLLVIGGKPLAVRQIDRYTVAFDLPEPYAAAERLFDSLAILPRHLLENEWQSGRIAQAWTLNTSPDRIAGMGPFRLKEYRPGERLVLERNPHYWKADRTGRRLPYLDQVEFQFAGSEEAQILRFSAGQADLLDRLSPRDFAFLAKDRAGRGDRLVDLGPGLEYSFLCFNLSPGSPKLAWFSRKEFRQAVSAAIDRESIVRLVFDGRAVPLWGHVPPGNRLWFDAALPRPPRSLDRARQLLSAAGFRWDSQGGLLDSAGTPVRFSLATSAGNPERVQMATIVQDDLSRLGIHVQLAPLEFRTLLDKVLTRRDFDTCLLALGGGDADPNAEMNIWLSSGGTHLWNPSQKEPASSWEREIDDLMRRQMKTLRYPERKRIYDRVQEIVSDQLPFVFLASPHVLVAARGSIGNFQPAVLAPHTLWNLDRLFQAQPQAASRP